MSDLRSRLGILRRQSGVLPGRDDGDDSTDHVHALRHRLQRLGAGRRRRSPRRDRISDEALAARLGGRVVRDCVILRRERLPVDSLHGAFPLSDSALHRGLSLCTGGRVATPRGCILMDTETTGLAGGTGTLVFLLGMARFSDGVLEIVQLFLTGFQGEGGMLEEARDFLRGADTLVTFNGRSFDSPLLAAR